MLRKYVEHNLRSSDHCPLKIRLIGCDQSHRAPPKSGLPRSVILFGIVLSGNPLAGLVADRAACLARGLAGASAFAAARHFFCRGAGDRLDLIHNASPYVAFFIIIIYRAQNCKRFWQKMRRRQRAERKSRALLHWRRQGAGHRARLHWRRQGAGSPRPYKFEKTDMPPFPCTRLRYEKC